MSHLTTSRDRASGALFLAVTSVLLTALVGWVTGVNTVVILLLVHAAVQVARWRIHRKST